MKKERLRILILEAINEVQTASGRQVKDISDMTVLTENLDGFDSMNAVEATAILANKLNEEGINVEIPVDVFLTDGEQPASFGYVLEEITRILEENDNGH